MIGHQIMILTARTPTCKFIRPIDLRFRDDQADPACLRLGILAPDVPPRRLNTRPDVYKVHYGTRVAAAWRDVGSEYPTPEARGARRDPPSGRGSEQLCRPS